MNRISNSRDQGSKVRAHTLALSLASLMLLALGSFPAPAQAGDLTDLAAASVTKPLELVNRLVVQPANQTLIRPVANTVRYVVRGPERSTGHTNGVQGFGGSTDVNQMATGSNLTESQKPSAYPGETIVRNATGITDRTIQTANQARRRVAQALDPW